MTPRQTSQSLSKSEDKVAPSPLLDAFVNRQEVACLGDTGSEATIMGYNFYVQRFEAQEQLDPCWLSLRTTKNLPILVEGISCVRIQIEDPRGGAGRGSCRPTAQSTKQCLSCWAWMSWKTWIYPVGLPNMNIRAVRCVAVACKLCGSECYRPTRPKEEVTKASRSGPYNPPSKSYSWHPCKRWSRHSLLGPTRNCRCPLLW